MQPVLSLPKSDLFARAKFPNIRFVYFIGPTCVGKGYIMRILIGFLKLLMLHKFINVGVISFGDIVKDLLNSSPEFRKAYLATIKAGNLVPDHEVIPIFKHEIEKLVRAGIPNLILVDGFCRSEQQIAFAQENGYLSQGDRVFMIEASESTCLARFMHRCETKPGGKDRIDAELPTFHHRYREHQRVAPLLRGMFLEADCVLMEVNGDSDILSGIAPVIQSELEVDFNNAICAEKYQPPIEVA